MQRTERFTGEKLGAVLDAQGRRRDWLAGRVGVSKSFVTHIIAGRRTVSRDVAERIAAELQVPFFMVFEFSAENETTPDEVAA